MSIIFEESYMKLYFIRHGETDWNIQRDRYDPKIPMAAFQRGISEGIAALVENYHKSAYNL